MRERLGSHRGRTIGAPPMTNQRALYLTSHSEVPIKYRPSKKWKEQQRGDKRRQCAFRCDPNEPLCLTTRTHIHTRHPPSIRLRAPTLAVREIAAACCEKCVWQH